MVSTSLKNSQYYVDQEKAGQHFSGSVGTRPLKPPKIRPALHLVQPEGQLQIHTSSYRGSFSVVLSAALRTAGLGSRVLIVQLLKGGVNQGPQRTVKLCGKLEWIRPDFPGCISKHISEISQQPSKPNPIEAVKAIWKICREKLLSGELDQLVIDEVGLAISLGYLNEADVIETLEKMPDAIDVILTGPEIPNRLTKMADQITELRCGF